MLQPKAKRPPDRHQYAKSISMYGAVGQGRDPISWWRMQLDLPPSTPETFVTGLFLPRKSDHDRVALQELPVAGHQL